MPAGTTVLLSGLGTLLIALGYVVLKRFRRSRCASHTKCCECESPEIKIQKENTERFDTILELVMKLTPKSEDPEPPNRPAKGVSTTGGTTTTLD